ncbi:hypothetical protein Fmac_024835 [Flemingia macrophylla]|uniref:Uncharacterized protein n=1 Tax=Flemingia macrophylla TaxID=520843 RepID=A0ABD1LQH9_9FABA
MSILRLMLQTSIASHHSSRGQTLDREGGFLLLAVSVQAMMPLSLEEFTTWLHIHLLKLESSFSARNDAIVIRGVHDVASDTSVETRKVEGKLAALVNLVTQLAVSQKPASVARQPGVNEFPEAYAGNIYSSHHSSRGQTLDREDGFQLLAVEVQEMMPLSLEEFTTWLQIHLLKLESFGARNDSIVIRGVHDVITDTSAETRKVEDKLDALVNLVTQLAANQKAASVARVCGIRSSNDHHTNRRWFPIPSSFRARNDAIIVRGVHDVAPETSAETRKVEGKLDALVNLVTQLVVNQKAASIARVCGIRSSNDHHTNVSPSS